LGVVFSIFMPCSKYMRRILRYGAFLGVWLLAMSAKEPLIKDSPKKLMEIEDETLGRINKIRDKKGLNTLKNIEYIRELAREHSLKMAQGVRSFGHRGWDERADLIFDNIEVEMVAENVAYNKGYDEPSSHVVNDWLKSREHKTNIMNEEFDITGVGVSKSSDNVYYFTQIFASYMK